MDVKEKMKYDKALEQGNAVCHGCPHLV